MPAPPLITVVVPTYRRPDSLRRLLESVTTQDDPGAPWEVVVVDNDDPPSAVDVVGAAAAAGQPRIRHVHEPRPGSAHARNRGIAEAEGEITVLVDDDVVAQAGWLRELVAPILADESDATAGRVELERPSSPPAWFDYDQLGPYLTHFDLGDHPRLLGAGDYIVSASAAYRTSLLRSVGGFDVELGPSGTGHLVCDDIRVHRKVVAAGGEVRYVPGSRVVHELPPSRLSRRYLLRRAFAQGRSDWLLDRAVLEPMRFHGLRVSLLWIRDELRRRRAEGLSRRSVRFHLLSDVARVAGNVAEMVRWRWAGSGDR